MKNPNTQLENLLFTTVRIETLYDNNEKSFGTGFFISYDFGDNKKLIFLVTNKHVIENGVNWKIPFNLSNGVSPFDEPIYGEQTGVNIGNPRYILRNGKYELFKPTAIDNVWMKHEKYDIAIADFTQMYAILTRNKKIPFIRTFNYNHIPHDNTIEKDIDAIEDVYIIGYPNALFDPDTLIPIVRRGITATPYKLDFENKPVFLIDASIFPGSSGSPVLLLDRNIQYKQIRNNPEQRSYLLGIVSSVHIDDTDLSEIYQMEIPVQSRNFVKLKQFLDLGVVYKSSIIKSMIDNLIKK